MIQSEMSAQPYDSASGHAAASCEGPGGILYWRARPEGRS